MSALSRVVRSGARRRRVQTIVIGLATLMAVTASVLGGSLLVASTAPFDHAFAAQRGSQLTAQFDAARATAARVSASAHAAGVTASYGPFPTASITPRGGSDTGVPADIEMPPMTLVGRVSRGGPIDDVTLLHGGWATGPGQVVLSTDGPGLDPGDTLVVPEPHGSLTLTVVGIARSVSSTADGWVTPAEAAALTAAGAPGGYQMLYRFASAGTTAQVAADRAAVKAAVPTGALSGTMSWLDVKQSSNQNSALFVPFLIAFGILGLVMSVLIVGNVVAGAVGTGLRRIGILKAIGFTPAQVVRAHIGQALIPATVGTVLGTVLGNVLAVPVLSTTNQVYGTATSGVDPWVDAAVIAGALGLVTLTAWVAALRAGRLRTVDAIAIGRTPRAGRGQWAARLSARVPLPRPISLGLAHPFARPGRAATTIAAIAFGATAVTFAVGLASSLEQVQNAKNHDNAAVTIDLGGPRGGSGRAPAPHTKLPPVAVPSAADPATVDAAIDAQPGTRAYYGMAQTQVSVAGVTGSSLVFAFTGDAAWAGYQMVSGSWFHGPGQAVVPTTFLNATGARIGDTVTLNDDGTTVPVRIVGEVFDPHTQTMEVFTDASMLAAAEPRLATTQSYFIAVRPGTKLGSYLRGLDTALSPLGLTANDDRTDDRSDVILALDTLTVILTLMLVVVAGLGVLNMVVLETRERVHDLGVHKALGMTPRQTIAMVIASVVVIGLVGGAVGVPVGVVLQSAIVPAMGHSAGLDLPRSMVDVYHTAELVLLGLGGLLIAVLGALLPAGWAARTWTATALRTE